MVRTRTTHPSPPLESLWYGAESIEWFIEDQAFSPSYDFGFSPTPSHSPVSKLYRRHRRRLRKRDNLLTGERLRGKQSIRLVLYNTLNTLWCGGKVHSMELSTLLSTPEPGGTTPHLTELPLDHLPFLANFIHFQWRRKNINLQKYTCSKKNPILSYYITDMEVF
jgi:hypothetical protein